MTITLPITLIQTAIRSKCPVAGIPVPGHAPIRLDRARLRDTLKGLTLIAAEYVDGNLKVTARGERIRAMRTFFPMSRADAGKLIDKFVKSQRAKMSKPKPANSAERKLQELKVKLDKLTFRPKNPAIAGGIQVSEHKRQQFLDWRNQRELRRQFNSKDAFCMAVLSGKLQAQMSNPATHYDWQRTEPEWGAERYRRSSLTSPDRVFIKDQIAVVLGKLHPGLRVTRISSFAPRAVA